jgi:diguanylate cyclase (GGDEF)-like protein
MIKLDRTINPQKEIVVVDDAPLNLRLLVNILSEQGYKVRPVNNGAMAIEAIHASPPDIILLDILLPEMDGYQVCQQLKLDPRTQEIPVIFLSAINQGIDKANAFKIGGADYITKPFEAEEVIARIEHQLNLRSLQIKLLQQNHQLRQEIRDRQRVEQKLRASQAALEKANITLERLATLDGLTGVANRRKFDEYLREEWRRMRREKQPLSLIMGDVDYFKQYNDTYGHPAGDTCLKAIAKAIKSMIKRPADLVARYGGEEYAIILPNTCCAGAIQVAESIRTSVHQLQLPNVESKVSKFVTLSLGVTSLIPQPSIPPYKLVAAADEALYIAKKQGRDRVCCCEACRG